MVNYNSRENVDDLVSYLKMEEEETDWMFGLDATVGKEGYMI